MNVNVNEKVNEKENVYAYGKENVRRGRRQRRRTTRLASAPRGVRQRMK